MDSKKIEIKDFKCSDTDKNYINSLIELYRLVNDMSVKLLRFNAVINPSALFTSGFSSEIPNAHFIVKMVLEKDYLDKKGATGKGTFYSLKGQ